MGSVSGQGHPDPHPSLLQLCWLAWDPLFRPIGSLRSVTHPSAGLATGSQVVPFMPPLALLGLAYSQSLTSLTPIGQHWFLVYHIGHISLYLCTIPCKRWGSRVLPLPLHFSRPPLPLQPLPIPQGQDPCLPVNSITNTKYHYHRSVSSLAHSSSSPNKVKSK